MGLGVIEDVIEERKRIEVEVLKVLDLSNVHCGDNLAIHFHGRSIPLVFEVIEPAKPAEAGNLRCMRDSALAHFLGPSSRILKTEDKILLGGSFVRDPHDESESGVRLSICAIRARERLLLHNLTSGKSCFSPRLIERIEVIRS